MSYVSASVSLLLAIAVLLVIHGGFKNRERSGERENKGIGWQFIRFNVICIGIPVVGILALNGALTGEAATLIAGAMAYAFGKSDGE